MREKTGKKTCIRDSLWCVDPSRELGTYQPLAHSSSPCGVMEERIRRAKARNLESLDKDSLSEGRTKGKNNKQKKTSDAKAITYHLSLAV